MTSKGNLETTVARFRACAICVRPGSRHRGQEILLVRLHDRVSGIEFLTPPGGGIEAGESALAAAIRETKEETGFDVLPLVPGASGRRALYDFVWEGKTYSCTTTFFDCVLVDPGQVVAGVVDTYYNRGARWIPIEDVPTALSIMPAVRDVVIESLRCRPPSR